MTKFHKDWLETRRMVRKINKQLKEDCFAGRFELRLTGRRQDYQMANYLIYTPELYTINEASDPTWSFSYYEAEVKDNEESERNFKIWFKLSENFGLIDCSTDNWEAASQYFENGGINSIWTVMNNFIIKSDFWEKWRDLEYQKTHWYSGEELERMMKFCGKAYKDPVSARKN